MKYKTLESIMKERREEKIKELDKWYNDFKDRFDRQFKIKKEEMLKEVKDDTAITNI